MRFTVFTSTITLVLALSSISVFAAPISRRQISNRLRTRNAQAAQHLNRTFRQLTESTGCSDERTACINDALAKCTGGTFQLEACPAEEACFAIPRTDRPGTQTLCATPADVKDAIESAGGKDGVFGTKEEPEVPQSSQQDVPQPSQQDVPVEAEEEVPRPQQDVPEVPQPSQPEEKPAEREKSEQDAKIENDAPGGSESAQVPAASSTQPCTTTTTPIHTASPFPSAATAFPNDPVTVTVTITHSSPPVVTLASQVLTTTLDPKAVESLLARLEGDEGVVVKTNGPARPTSVDIELPGVAV